jgi:hypothetical protein
VDSKHISIGDITVRFVESLLLRSFDFSTHKSKERCEVTELRWEPCSLLAEWGVALAMITGHSNCWKSFKRWCPVLNKSLYFYCLKTAALLTDDDDDDDVGGFICFSQDN